MYSRFHLVKKFIHYYVTASNGKGHGIHSPFVFDFVVNVLNDRRHFYHYDAIESLREGLLGNQTILEIEDFGAGSAVDSKNKRSIASIAKNASKNKKLSQLLFRIAHHYEPKIILELGTSLGISSAYMASAAPQSHVITIEGAQSAAEIARANLAILQLDNVEVITGEFEKMLPNALKNLVSVDLAFIDGNHRLEPTRNYFEQLLVKATPESIFIFDDIHWSKEMEDVWSLIKQRKEVTATIDLFFIGIVLFRPSFKSKQDFTIRF